MSARDDILEDLASVLCRHASHQQGGHECEADYQRAEEFLTRHNIGAKHVAVIPHSGRNAGRTAALIDALKEAGIDTVEVHVPTELQGAPHA